MCQYQQDIWFLRRMYAFSSFYLFSPPTRRFIFVPNTSMFFFSLRLGKRRYNIKLWKTFTDCFNCLPIAAIIDEKIFTMHGGLSPDLQSMEQIRRVMRPTDVPDTGEYTSLVHCLELICHVPCVF